TASRPTSPQGPTSVQKLSEVEMSMAFGFEFDKPGPADLRDSLRARLKPDELHLLMNLVEPVRNLYLDKWMGLTSGMTCERWSYAWLMKECYKRCVFI
ncbi:hypothetical protein SARC_14346, partial [Sphaeroforma arctica JP610]